MNVLLLILITSISPLYTSFAKEDRFFSINATNSNSSLLLNEINYSGDENEHSLNYLEFINLDTKSINLNDYSFTLTLDNEEEKLNIPPNSLLLNTGYFLIDFTSSIQLPLPDLYLVNLSFNKSIKVEISYKNNGENILVDSVLFSKGGEGFPLTKTGENISIQRKDDYGTPINTGDDKNDFEYFLIGTPTNSALGVAHYIMAETIEGQAKYKYPVAKAMVSSLTEPQKNFFKTDDSQYMKDTRKRYINWANSERDHDPYNDGLRPPAQPISKKTVALIIGAFVLLVGGGIFVIKRKNNI
jgi:hypothetical protein